MKIAKLKQNHVEEYQEIILFMKYRGLIKEKQKLDWTIYEKVCSDCKTN